MFSIILPTFNEKDNIGLLIESIFSVLNQSGNNSFEIIVIDDNSPDGTSSVVEKYNKNNPQIRLIIRTKERGLATAIKTGILNTKGDYIIIMDTDFSHPPSFIIKLIETIKEGDYDVVIASRYIKGGGMSAPRYKYFLSKLMNNIIMQILDIKIKDLTGGFFIIKKSLLEKLDLDKIFLGYGDYFYRLFYELKKEEYTFKEIPFYYEKRKMGLSKTNTLKMGIDYLKTLFYLRCHRQ